MKWENRAMVLPWSDHEGGIVDGDTIDVLLDLGHHQYHAHRARLRGVDTAEVWGTSMDSDEFDRGMDHLGFTAEWIGAAQQAHDGAWPLLVRTHKLGKYGRLVADVTRRSDYEVLQNALIDEYHGVNDGFR